MQKQENPTYLKAITIRDSSDVHSIKEDIKKGIILILRVTPLAQKDVDQLRKVVEELYSIAKTADAVVVGSAIIEKIYAAHKKNHNDKISIVEEVSNFVKSLSNAIRDNN